MFDWLKLQNYNPIPKINFTENDAKILIPEYRKDIEQKLKDQLIFNSSGVIVLESLKQEINEIVNGLGRTTIGLIASRLDIQQQLVKDIIQQISPKSFYIKDSVIICGKEIQKLSFKLESEVLGSKGAIESLKFCTDNRLDRQGLDLIIGKAINPIRQVSDLIISEFLYEQTKNRILCKLITAKVPLNINELRCPVLETNPLMWKLLLETCNDWIKEYQDIDESDGQRRFRKVNGSIDRNNVFIPTNYKEKLYDELQEKLNKNGYLPISELSDIGIKDFTKYFHEKKPEITNLKTIACTNDYINQQIRAHQNQLDNENWTELLYEMPVKDEEILIHKIIIPRLSGKFSVEKQGSYTFIIRNSLINDKKTLVNNHFKQQAIRAAEELLSEMPNIERRELSQEISCLSHGPLSPNSSSIEKLFTDLNQLRLKKVLCNRILKSAQQGFVEQVCLVLEKYVTNKENKESMKQLIYFNGAETVKPYDLKLKNALNEELITRYTHKPTMEFDYSELEITRVELLRKLKQKLKAATDIALILHLTVIIIHSELFSKLLNQPVMIKASGRYVPKLLKVIEKAFPQQELNILKELRNVIKEQEKIPKKDEEEMASKVKTYAFEQTGGI